MRLQLPKRNPSLQPNLSRTRTRTKTPFSARLQSTGSYQPPSLSPQPQPQTHQQAASPASQANPPNPHSAFYRTFGRAWAKNFLIAVATYQILYWGWKKLESVEVKSDAEREIRGLQGELRALTQVDSSKDGR